MFRKLFSKILGNTGGAVADAVVTTVLDASTEGAATKVERAVEAVDAEVKRRKRS